MNLLLVGEKHLPPLPFPFLLIDDEITISLPKRRKVIYFDRAKHSFNPLKNIDYQKAVHFVEVINAAFPEGANTLTRQRSTIYLLQSLLANPRSLAHLLPQGQQYDDARLKIERLLLSPVLNRVLLNPTNFSFKGTILARLNRADLGDFDCFVLGNLLISQYQGQVVIPDFGFYGCPFHVSLIRQNRLIAGVRYLDETPYKNDLLLIDTKIGCHTTAKDAETLAQYKGLLPHTNVYNDFIERAVNGLSTSQGLSDSEA